MRSIRIGLFGLGTVGGGVVRILKEHREDFIRHAGVQLDLVAVTARGVDEAERLGIAELYTTADDIFERSDIDIIIELIGGTGFAYTVVKSALEHGKHVVTANKALMASFGEELLGLASAKKLNLAFEASVGGGIPIILPLKHSLVGNEISTVLGIVNGTTNYMLTRMGEDGLTYNDALAEAQARGFAEADPSADVDGLDAAAKIAILASIAFNSRVTLKDVAAEGIRTISPLDFSYAHNMGYAIKLLAIACRTPQGIDVRVHPTMIPLKHPLAGVNGVYNAIYVIGDAVGETMFFGEGAGSGPAASAVMGDVIEVARQVSAGIEPVVGCTCVDSLPIRPMDQLISKYYVRLDVIDKPGVLAATSAILSEHNVSINSMVQSASEPGGNAQLVYVMHPAREKDIMEALDRVAALPVVSEVATVIRIYDDKVE